MQGQRIYPADKSRWLLLFRSFMHDPKKILKGLVKAGDTAADIGCGPGYFIPALSAMAGQSGRVFAADVQAAMLDKAKNRCYKHCENDNVIYLQVREDLLALPAPVDFLLAFYMVHETPDAGKFFTAAAHHLKPGARMLVAEPVMRVTEKEFGDEKNAAGLAGLVIITEPRIFMSRAMLLEKKQ